MWSWVDTELQLDFLSEINRQSLHEKSSKTRTGSATEGMEHEKSLKARAVIGNPANLVQDLVDKLLSNSVMTSGVVVGGIFLAGDHMFRVEKVSIGTRAHLVNDIGLEIAVNCSGDIFSVACRVVKNEPGGCCGISSPVSEKKVLDP